MKKFSAFMCMLLIMLTICLTGCAGFEVNRVKYYNDVVAKVGDTKIKRYELLSAYSSYGQTYFATQQGQEPIDALNSTLDMLIDRELLYQYALENKSTYGLSRYQVNQVVQVVFDSVDSQMETYVKDACLSLGVERVNNETNNPTNETAYKHEDYVYSPRAEVVKVVTYFEDEDKTIVSKVETDYYTVEYKIKYIVDEEDNSFDALVSEKYLTDYTADGFASEVKAKYLEHFKASLANQVNSEKVYNKALNLLAQGVMNYEKYLRDENGKAYNKKTDDLVYRYIERNIEAQIKSQLLTNISTDFHINKSKLDISELTTKYQDLVNYSYTKYRNREEVYKKDMKDIGTKGDTVLYHKPLSDGTKFGYFAHTLFQFTQKQKDDIAALDKNSATYESDYNTILSKTVVHPRNLETGLVDNDVELTLDEVMLEYREITNIAKADERLEAFIQFMFKYTGDTATLSAGMPYVVGTNGNSGMEEAFTNEAVRLMTEGAVGDMTPASTNDMCVTSYGIHLLYFIGDVGAFDVPYTDTDAVYIQNEDRVDNASANLYFKELNPLTHERYFDMLFDEVYPAANSTEPFASNTGYGDYEDGIIAEMKNKVKPEKFTTKVESCEIG